MPALKHVYDKLDEIPEPFRELYAEKGGKFEVTGITGVRTQADVDRIDEALRKEREAHKETKAALKPWAEFKGKPDEILAMLDRIPELEAAAKDKLDAAGIEAAVTKRTEGVIRTRLAPVERELAKVIKERDELRAERDTLSGRETVRKNHDTIRPLLRKAKIAAEVDLDALPLASAHLEFVDGRLQTREGLDGIPSGLDAEAWLEVVLSTRPHWLPPSQGGGGRGSGKFVGGKNPWSREGWSKTEQGAYLKTHGLEKATAAAQAAGVGVYATKPAAAAK